MKVYFLEGRGGVYIFHFIVYNLGGIYNIINKINPRNTDSIKLIGYNNIHYNDDTFDISYPIPIIVDGITDGTGKLNEWQTEICNYLSNKIKIISTDTLTNDDNVISIYGVTLYTNCVCDNPEKYFPFLRNLFLDNDNINTNEISIPRKRYYITRKYSNLIHNEKLRKFIRNEEALKSILNKYNFEYVILEQMCIKDKIILFNTADTILSTNSGGLVFSLVAGKDTKIIEIVNKSDGVNPIHYKLICNTLNIPYYRYSNINEDRLGNFDININDFDNYLQNIL
jgi:capsular polysaccharide biosynthesis protein